jgi:uncharacterized protein YndB with AHSA1/START domain
MPIIVSRVLDHPVERVFPYLADPERWPEFVPAVKLRRRLDLGPVRIGSQWAAVDRIGPLDVRFTDELLVHEAGRLVRFGHSAPWRATSEYRFDALGERTRVTSRFEGDVQGWLRVLTLVPDPIIGRILAGDLRRLAALLDRREPASAHEEVDHDG